MAYVIAEKCGIPFFIGQSSADVKKMCAKSNHSLTIFLLHSVQFQIGKKINEVHYLYEIETGESVLYGMYLQTEIYHFTDIGYFLESADGDVSLYR